MSKNTKAILARIQILLNNNKSAKGRIAQSSKRPQCPKKGEIVENVQVESPKLTFGIDTILTMKCSTQKKRENIQKLKMIKNIKYKNLKKCEFKIRTRTSFTLLQQQRLVKTFQKDRYISGCAGLDLAEELGLDIQQVKVWFRNRRKNWL
jgi:hypothetical protein